MNDFPLNELDMVELPHPRPQMMRKAWTSLNGVWDFCNGRGQSWTTPAQVEWDKSITVPFSPETEASGVNDTGFYTAVWYRRSWEQPTVGPGERLWLHFEAVDWRATVWVNGREVAFHEGGYTPFGADITDALTGDPLQEVVVRAEDDHADLAKPRGKQDWQLEAHSIWYPRTTGIWQSVWLETLPASRIQALQWSCSLARWDIGIEALIRDAAEPHSGEQSSMQLSVHLHVGEQLIAHDTYAVVSGEVHRRIALSDPGIDDYRNALLWRHPPQL